ncbi:MAG: hypothetical protein V2A73_15880, partial [Pseudomonadota bacterium]
ISTSRLTLGIDEAGRGPILGPLVMAGVCVCSSRAAALTRAGVLDSKAFGSGDAAHSRRSELARRITEMAESIVVIVIEPQEIDRRVHRHELNVLEREVASDIIERSATADRIVADGERLFSPLRDRYPNLRACDRGEAVHVAVAAASVIAKVRRDDVFAGITQGYRAEFGAISGGGYANEQTLRFLRSYIERYRCLPPEARRTWRWARLEEYLPRDAPKRR